jgi:hypothetical protein
MNNIQIYEECVKYLIFDAAFTERNPPISLRRRYFALAKNKFGFGIPQYWSFKKTIVMMQDHLKTVNF